MFLIFLFIISSQFMLVINKESTCGCSINRNSEDKGLLSTVPREEQEYCSKNKESCLIDKEAGNERKSATEEMIYVPAGEYQFGTNDIAIESDKEGPKRMVKLDAYYLDKYEVSNRDFMIFTESTKYKTEAEIFGDSFVFSLFLDAATKEALVDYRAVEVPWWYKVSEADWKHPNGPNSDIKDVLNHPVIHVSWNDAKAYCKWREARLPTEAEWEAACRAGQQDILYPWGDKLFPNKTFMANIWQGSFPSYNTAKDGYIGTNPVDVFRQNDWEFHNIVGNVWEWTEDAWTEQNPKEKVKKGGSYLCHKSYCYRYRCSARSQNTEDSSASNLGFRCANEKLLWGSWDGLDSVRFALVVCCSLHCVVGWSWIRGWLWRSTLDWLGVSCAFCIVTTTT